jgi:protein-L-isoaspartate(D-aspartate) O-methyltransferase
MLARTLCCGFAVALALGPAQPMAAQSRAALDDARRRMVQDDLVANGIKNERVLEAMRTIPRHDFVPTNLRHRAYLDMGLPIGEGQTISSPFIVAFMTEQLDPQPNDRVLEIGTGSGYQAAILSALVAEVYSIEIVEPLGRRAARALRDYTTVRTKIGDGFLGWPEAAPFDKIIVTCSPERVPVPLVEQLKEGGRMVIPVGQRYQQTMYLFTKKDGKLVPEALRPTYFVPMTGHAEERREIKPDPANPSIANGSFEDVHETTRLPIAWYYMRNMAIVGDDTAPDGKRFACFTNDVPGQMSHTLQGFACDGREAKLLDVKCTVKGKNLRPGPSPDQRPMLGITFFDERRAPISEVTIGPWFGTFDWTEEKARIQVPVRAREASIRVGLLGATGEICFDDIRVERGKP